MQAQLQAWDEQRTSAPTASNVSVLCNSIDDPIETRVMKLSLLPSHGNQLAVLRVWFKFWSAKKSTNVGSEWWMASLSSSVVESRNTFKMKVVSKTRIRMVVSITTRRPRLMLSDPTDRRAVREAPALSE